MKYTNKLGEKFEPIIQEAIKVAKEVGLEIKKPVIIIVNPRLKTTLARCYTHKNPVIIDFHEGYLKEASIRQLIETMLHEMIHAAGVNNHGQAFKHWANKITNNTRYNITRTGTNPAAQRMERKYLFKCRDCRNEFTRAKKTKVVRSIMNNEMRYRCARCGGVLDYEGRL